MRTVSPKNASVVAFAIVFLGGIVISLLAQVIIGFPEHLFVSMPLCFILGWHVVEISNALTKKEEPVV